MKTFDVDVTISVRVTLDEEKFNDPEFKEDWRTNFYPNIETLEDHAKNLAQLFAREFDMMPSSFVEGYGYMRDMGVTFEPLDQTEEIV